MTFEVHLFNFNDVNLYGQYIDIEFVDYIRCEKKFNNLGSERIVNSTFF